MFAAALMILCGQVIGADPAVGKIIGEIARKAADSTGAAPIRGKDGWLFFHPDLRCLTADRLWSESTGVLPAILDFKAQLDRSGAGLTPVPDWRGSPILLLGDSHNLVFHAGGDMHATGAGFADQLAFELGFPVDIVAVRGSGATPSRLNLMRRGDNLAGKKLVIWCLSVREYVESQGWKLVPVIR
jgi:hypothetical protein